MVSLLAFLPTLVLSVPAGVLADRLDRRMLMMIGDGCSALGLIFILLCMMYGEAALWQICVGVTISSVFSALLEPSYRATVTDLLTKEEYSKANGLVSLAGSARYLISPILAAGLLVITDIKVLLIIDICTFFLTVTATSVVRRGLVTKLERKNSTYIQDFKDGWHAIAEKRGVLILIIMSSLMTCSMGAIQTLSSPMILDFADSKTLGVAETVCACGMLVSSLFLGIKGIKKNFVLVLSGSLFGAGVGMVLFGCIENIVLIVAAGFFFFCMLPFANNSLDYLVRTNIDDELQGRAWGLIGFLSQIGYVVAYGLGGIMADSIAKVWSISVGRGSAMVIIIGGIFLAVLAVFTGLLKSIRSLEH